MLPRLGTRFLKRDHCHDYARSPQQQWYLNIARVRDLLDPALLILDWYC
jgi:hypothetical protein